MLREKKAPSAPSGPRDFSPSKPNENIGPRPGIPSGPTSTFSTSRSNNSMLSFGRGNDSSQTDDDTSASYEFLISPSFDDLQNTIPTLNDTQGSYVASVARGKKETMEAPTTESRPPLTARASASTRPVRSGSILRRTSTSARPNGTTSTTTTGGLGAMDPPAAPAPTRNRRQSHYPPVSSGGSANAAARAPRKSIDSDFSKSTQRRRPSLAASYSLQGLSDAVATSTRANNGTGNSYKDGARGLTASRAAKTKSLQPPSRQSQTNIVVNTPDHSRSSSFAARSPAKPNRSGATTPSSSAKKMLVMPGLPQTSHATGLGARTVSPTDARRAKRLSVLQNPPPMPNTPPQPSADVSSTRISARSPSMLPRKVPTPSSARTTPDPNRKSFNSSISIPSSSNLNNFRTSTGSIQARLSQPLASSRLPTPKPRNVHSSTGNNEEQEVPPVPAIPKAYESPKQSPAEMPVFSSRKSSLPFDVSSINSTSTTSLSGRGSIRETTRSEREKTQHNDAAGSTPFEQQAHAAPSKRKNLQPLRLPPLNLLPLSTPTAAKVAALQEGPHVDRNSTPPPRRGTTKTPSTPMTASKASFFSRNRHEKDIEISTMQARSSSSIHQLRPEPAARPGKGVLDATTQPITINNEPPAGQAVSPFMSASLPKTDVSFTPKSRTVGEVSNPPVLEHRPAKLTGPRAPKTTRPAKIDTPTRMSSPEEPTTPSSGNSLRRKLSLGWKRSTSKSNINNSHAASERDQEYAPLISRHDNMPPPKLPASATMNNMATSSVSSPTPSTKAANYLDSKRRKSSVSSLSILNGHDRKRSDSWGINGSPKKEKADAKLERPAPQRSTSSVMNKMLNGKSSTSSIRTHDPWTVDLDKDDLMAEDEMRRLGTKRKETEAAARQLDGLRKRATPKGRVSPKQACLAANLNIYERGEVMDFPDIFFCGTQSAAKHVGQVSDETHNFGYDDERGDYTITVGDHLSYRYEIIDILGKGSFGQVVRCIDHKTGGLVAIKIIRNKKRFHQQALVEVNILQRLREWDPANKHSMVNFTQSFYFRGHLCISTELLDMNLYEFIKSNSFRGFSLKIVRRFTKQLLSSLIILKQHKVIHCDLKPENILLTHPLHSEIKVIDFGSSCFENQKVYTYIQSRFYRSPEVILGMTYGMPIDMWSLGCILAELFTGIPIFPGENEQEQLACIMEIFGPPDKQLVERSTRRKLFFDSLGKPRLTVSSKGRRRRPSSKTLAQVMKTDDEAFLEFLTRCMRWDPERRLKPDEALKHEFISGQKRALTQISQPTTMKKPTDSPLKRNNTITGPSITNRPLPEPPVTSYKNGAPVRTIRQVSGGSPAKPQPPVMRRVSNVNNTDSTRRISTGPVLAAGGSNLPRVMTRSVSARQDLAAVGAGVAMGKRV
ncbi:hypothetical protein BJ878DRAFT_148052 [Calycina marina]|uniref:Protein kinase domain-containing protein n=1 Tax=Calycina marina TaxID=1763456 RepID=A0A9P7Z0W3_9HELO|nr:hypothetical protein BJ878DRAFT_148052 [Calycina marina]